MPCRCNSDSSLACWPGRGSLAGKTYAAGPSARRLRDERSLFDRSCAGTRPVVRDLVQRDQQRALLQVHVVADRPDHLRSGVFGRCHCRSTFVEQVVRRVARALRLVEATDRVAHVRDPEHVVRRPAVVEVVRVDAGHAERRHVGDFLVGQPVPLVDHDRVEPRVVRAAAGRRVQVRRGLVQVVQHRRVPVEERAHDVLRERELQRHAVPVVVVRHVLAPVQQPRDTLAFGSLRGAMCRSTCFARPSTSTTGVMIVITLSRISRMNGIGRR
jgi:hypothetical protein